MRFCEDHWTRLREALNERDLGAFVAEDGQRAAQKFAQALGARRDTLDNFDPLMGAHWSIVGRIANVQPDVLMIDGCPLCWARDQHGAQCPGPPECKIDDQWFEDWIPSVADHMAKKAATLLQEATTHARPS